MNKLKLQKLKSICEVDQSILAEDEDDIDIDYNFDRLETYKIPNTKRTRNISQYSLNESMVSLEVNNISSLFLKKFPKNTDFTPSGKSSQFVLGI